MQGDLPESAAASPASILGSNSPSQPSSRKRKAPSSGSRGVASLTPEQLAKKRANDRDAQRAIRERTKQTIESLERRIRELESQQPYQELQVVVRQKEAIQAENDEIRRRLTNVLAIIQPVVGAQRLTDLASAAHHNVQAGLAQPGNAFQPEPFLNDPSRSYTDSASLPQGQASSYAFPPPETSPAPDNRAWQPSASRGDGLDQQRDSVDRSLTLSDSADRNTFNFLLSPLGQRDTSQVANQQGLAQPPVSRPIYPTISNQPYVSAEPIWHQLPKHVEPTCTLDSILLGFYETQRAALAAAAAAAAASSSSSSSPDHITQAYPSMHYFLDPSSPQAQHIDPVSELSINIISKFPNISGLPEQAAIILFTFHMLNWHINPTEENYQRIPDWMKPSQTQLEVPHPAWIDYVHWPKLRDKMVPNYQDFPFDSIFVHYTIDLSVNWPYEASDCLLKIPAAASTSTSTSTSSSGHGHHPHHPHHHHHHNHNQHHHNHNHQPDTEVIFNPAFERHVRRLENWAISQSIVDAFPSTEGAVNVRPPPPPVPPPPPPHPHPPAPAQSSTATAIKEHTNTIGSSTSTPTTAAATNIAVTTAAAASTSTSSVSAAAAAAVAAIASVGTGGNININASDQLVRR